jgi:ATP-dependent helicase HrpA
MRCEDAYAELCAQAPPGPLPDFVDDIGWLLEELRVGLFAQPLRDQGAGVGEAGADAIERAARPAGSTPDRSGAHGRLGAWIDPASSTP